MEITRQLAKHLRAVHFGGNWTSVNMRETVAGLTWEQATTKVYSFNTIAVLLYHSNYYVSAVLKVLQGQPLHAKDQHSFEHPPINSREEWERLLQKTWDDAEAFAAAIEQLPDDVLGQTFIDDKYGSYYRNLQGIIEHTHYHLGQMVLIKKLLNYTTPAHDSDGG